MREIKAINWRYRGTHYRSWRICLNTSFVKTRIDQRQYKWTRSTFPFFLGFFFPKTLVYSGFSSDFGTRFDWPDNLTTLRACNCDRSVSIILYYYYIKRTWACRRDFNRTSSRVLLYTVQLIASHHRYCECAETCDMANSGGKQYYTIYNIIIMIIYGRLRVPTKALCALGQQAIHRRRRFHSGRILNNMLFEIMLFEIMLLPW